jgi:uncharacterized YigZ family protein
MAESSPYLVATGQAQFELREKGSRFLAILEPAISEASARSRIKTFQQEHRDATHVCWAWRIGSPSAEGRSDAGEPAGTAGTPMLQVLRGADLSDVLAVVIRWFGGTKLGKGGLARAYASAVKGALLELEVTERRPTTTLRVSVPYSRVGDLKRLIQPPAIVIVEEVFSKNAEFTLEVDNARTSELEEALGGIAIEIAIAGS